MTEIFTNVDRVLPVFEYLSDNKNINVGSVFPFLVLKGDNKINFSFINIKACENLLVWNKGHLKYSNQAP